MAYEAHKWKIGEEITSDKLNHIEKGIEEAGLPREITDPQDGQTLKYDAESGKWVNGEGGSVSSTLVVQADSTTRSLDKTWQEIFDAFPNVYTITNINGKIMKNPVVQVNSSDGNYFVYSEGYNITSQSFVPMVFRTNTTEGYPIALESN